MEYAKPSAIDADIIEKAVQLRHLLHSEPELSGLENETKRRLMDFLTENTSLAVRDMGEWFYAVYCAPGEEPGRRRIAFRADMDALPIDEGNALPYSSKTPGVSHKCGHDGHMASLAAFALTVDRRGSKNDIFFLFQNAEETGTGAEKAKALIGLEKIDEIYGYHNMPGFPLCSVAVHTGAAACASKGLVFRFTGENSHASQPENGRNPAFALARLTAEIPLLVRIAAENDPGGVQYNNETEVGGTARRIAPGAYMSRDGIVMCTVVGTHIGSREDGGEEAFGTSAGYGRLMMTIRAENEKRMDLLESLLLERAKALAEEDGINFASECREPFPETRNDAACAEKVRAAVRKLGFETAVWNEPFRSSEDFGWYTKLTPGALFYIGSGEEHAPLHTVGYDFPDALIPAAAALFYELSK
ncbi:MAG: M20/M25/M40 family metallo-hydrolase [Clostridia bacterium]|nr:M20/M25/M40 family metallo-hydrolase [Clostridia bacterium]